MSLQAFVILCLHVSIDLPLKVPRPCSLNSLKHKSDLVLCPAYSPPGPCRPLRDAGPALQLAPEACVAPAPKWSRSLPSPTGSRRFRFSESLRANAFFSRSALLVSLPGAPLPASCLLLLCWFPVRSGKSC